jgi:hypothetical protein
MFGVESAFKATFNMLYNNIRCCVLFGGHNGTLGPKRASCGGPRLKLKRNVREPEQTGADPRVLAELT